MLVAPCGAALNEASATANAAVECGYIAQIYRFVDGKYEFLQEM